MTSERVLLLRLVEWYDTGLHGASRLGDAHGIIDDARALLAEPEVGTPRHMMRVPLRCACGNRDDVDVGAQECSAGCGRWMEVDKPTPRGPNPGEHPVNNAFLLALVAGALPEPWSDYVRRLSPDQMAHMGGILADKLREIELYAWDENVPWFELVAPLYLAGAGGATLEEQQTVGARYLAIGFALCVRPLPFRPEDAP